MLKDILDNDLIKPSRCHRKDCPTDNELKQYPMLDEDHFDMIDERLYHCQKCKNRMARLDGSRSKLN